MRYIVLRLSNVYGRYDISDRFVPRLIQNMRKNQDVFIYGKEKMLDFTYLDDCVNGIIKSVIHFSQAQNSTINIASGEGHTLVKVSQLIKELLGSKSKIHIKPNRKGEVLRFIANISRAKTLLEYKPKYSIQRGFKAAVEWYLQNV